MILVTVGTQLGFDRLIRAMDDLAVDLSLPVLAQIGDGEYVPRNMAFQPLIQPAEFDELARVSQLVVGHAGTGTILTAAKFKKPAVLLPRRASLGEHRNDHQLATAHAFGSRAGIFIAMDEKDLGKMVTQALEFEAPLEEESVSRHELQKSITDYLHRWG